MAGEVLYEAAPLHPHAATALSVAAHKICCDSTSCSGQEERMPVPLHQDDMESLQSVRIVDQRQEECTLLLQEGMCTQLGQAETAHSEGDDGAGLTQFGLCGPGPFA